MKYIKSIMSMMVIWGLLFFSVIYAESVSAESLTTEEIKLYASHPIKAAKAKECAETATKSTEDKYKECVRWQGNGDAYRHAYWSALMTKNIDENFAWKAGLAHERLKPGYEFDKQNDDTKMDIMNNYIGRQLGEVCSSKTDKNLATMMAKICSSGRLRRIRVYSKNKVTNCEKIGGVWMKYVGYYVKTSDGGLK